MKISQAIKHLTVIKEKFGDLTVVGGYLDDVGGMDNILVVDKQGAEIYPTVHGDINDVEGVFLT